MTFVTIVATASGASVAVAAPGELDTSFNGTGKLLVNFDGFDRATQAAIAPDGHIVVVGSTDVSGAGDYAIARVDASGTLDKTFSADGLERLGSQPGVEDTGGSVVVLGDESIVVTGQGNSTKDFVTKRLESDGEQDMTFGEGGASVVDFGGEDMANDMVRQPDGKLVIVGSTSAGGGDFAIARLNADGSLDNSFSGDGKQTVDFGGKDEATGVALTAEGKIVVVGEGGAGHDMAVTRLNSDGSVDTSFSPGTSGKELVDFGGGDSAKGVALQADGKIVMEGSTDAVGEGDVAVARLEANGGLDTSFSGDGKLTLGYGAPNEIGTAVAVQQNGRIVVMADADPNKDFVVTRLNGDGSIDTSFGSGGTATVDYGKTEFDGDAVLQPDGNIVLVGSTDVGPNWDMAITRLIGDPVSTGGGGGGTIGGAGSAPPEIQVSSTPGPGGHGMDIDLQNTTGASTFKLDINGDGHPDYSGPASLPFFRVYVPQSTHSPVGITAIGPTGATSTATTGTGIVGFGVTTKKFGPLIQAGGKAILEAGAEASAPCDQAQVVEGLIEARGCFTLVTSLSELPPSVTAAVSRYYKSPVFPEWLLTLCPASKNDEVCKTLRKLFVTQPTYVSYKPVQLDGITIRPASGPIVIYPDQSRVFSLSAVATLGPFPIHAGPLDLDLTGFSIPFFFPPGFALTGPLFEFDARKGLPAIGGFPLDAGGQVGFAIENGVREAVIGVHVKLPPAFDVFGDGEQPSAEAGATVTNDRPFKLETIELNIPHASIGGLGFEHVSFKYNANGDGGACHKDYWDASADFVLGESVDGQSAGILAAPPPPENGIAFCGTSFQSAGLHIHFALPALPPPEIFPSVELTDIGAFLSLDPTVLKGHFEISTAELFDIEGDGLFTLASIGQPYFLTKASAGPGLQEIAPRTFTSPAVAIGGAFSFETPFGFIHVFNASAMYQYPDYVAIGASANIFAGIFHLIGHIGGDLNVRQRAFQLTVSGEACISGFKLSSACVGGTGILGSKGVAACIHILGLERGMGIHSDGSPEFWIFKGCKLSRFWVAVNGRASAHEAAAGELKFRVAPGETEKDLELAGIGGAPAFEIHGPGGESFTLSDEEFSEKGHFAGVRSPTYDKTYFGVKNGPPGVYTITPLPGSPTFSTLSETRPGYDSDFTAKVTGTGNRRTLHYDARKHGGGQQVSFFEKGEGVWRRLTTSTGGRASLRFTPAAGRRGTRTIVSVATVDGVPLPEQTLARFRFAGTPRTGRPRSVTVTRHGKTLHVRWVPVAGAVRYGIVVAHSDGSQQTMSVSAHKHSFSLPYPAVDGGTVSVSAKGPLGDWGPARRSAQFKATKTRPPVFFKPRKRHRKH
ncbi:MAG TPA: hypothetical protein VGG08_06360 [Solirubrobacteraceae bacterium]